MAPDHPAGEEHDHDRGLRFDLETLSRRRALALISGGTLAVLVGCGSNGEDAASPTTTSGAGSQPTAAGGSGKGCDVIPEETAGPFPGDGSNGPNVLAENGIVRSDIRSSFGSSNGTAQGVPLTVNLVVLDSTGNCQARPGTAVYVWQCDREARYSLYSQGAQNQNYLRGVQEADSDGRVSFQSIFPAAYSGRWPHIHFEVYKDLAAATGGQSPIATSQVALPQSACDEVYATAGYEQSMRNMARTSLQSDNVFRGDGGGAQLGTATGDVTAGYTVELAVPVEPSRS